MTNFQYFLTKEPDDGSKHFSSEVYASEFEARQAGEIESVGDEYVDTRECRGLTIDVPFETREGVKGAIRYPVSLWNWVKWNILTLIPRVDADRRESGRVTNFLMR